MTKQHTPQDTVASVLADPVLPRGDDERFVGFGIMGLPFANGHYLAMRQFPATSFAPPYVSVWHRDPSCNWTFYATTPGQQSCARYFSSATPKDAVQCDISVGWAGPWSVRVEIPGLLQWTFELQATAATRLMSIGRHPAVRVGVERPDDSAAAQPSGNPHTRRRGHSADGPRSQRAVLHDGPEAVVGRRPTRTRFYKAAIWARAVRCSGRPASATFACRSAESAWSDRVTSRRSTLTGIAPPSVPIRSRNRLSACVTSANVGYPHTLAGGVT